MRKLITSLLVISLVFFFDINKNAYAYNINNIEIIKLEQSNNSQFFNYSLDTEKLSNNNNSDDDDDEPINPNFIFLNFIIPSLGNLFTGVFVVESILYTIIGFSVLPALLSIPLSILNNTSEYGKFLNNYELKIILPLLILVYLVNIIFTNLIYFDLSKKYLKKMKNKEKKLSLENQSLVFNYEIKF